jgi:hypothetical protein
MRIKHATLAVSFAALAAMTAPALAKKAGAPKSDDKSTSSSCHAYQQAADGSWTELPCQELGSQGQPQRKPATRTEGDETR